MMNGINFGGEGPVMHGTWYNPHTGDAFTVRDSFFEDNQYIVMTTDGRKLDYNNLQNYIQSDMKLEDLKKTRIEQHKKEEIPAEIKSLIASNDDAEDYLIPEDNIFSKPLGNINNPTPRHIAPAVSHTSMGNIHTPVNMNDAIIEKALKNAGKPKFVVNVEWDDFPIKQIDMLMDVMEIAEADILEWYLSNIDMVEIAEAVKDGIRKRLVKEQEHTMIMVCEPLITEEQPIVVIEEPAVVQPKSSTPKKPATKKPAVKKSETKKPTTKKSQPKKS